MANDDLDLDDLLRDMRPILVAVYQRGYRAGGDAMKRAIQQLVSEPEVDADAGVGAAVARVEAKGNEGAHQPERNPTKRAPRGLAELAVAQIFVGREEVDAKDLERLVCEFDDRVNPKTVYNILLRKKDEFSQVNGRWVRRRADAQPSSAENPPLPPWLRRVEAAS